MTSRFEWAGVGSLSVISVVAIALTAWQSQIDRSPFGRFFGAMHPVVVMTGVAVAGIVALASLQGSSGFVVSRPGACRDAISMLAWSVPALAAAAICADIVLRYPEDTNIAMPDALRFYPAIAVFVEMALHAVPIAVLVAILGSPAGWQGVLWKIAVPVALVEAIVQAVDASSLGTSIFSAVHLMVFGMAQVWVFWRFGFVWMLGFRLFYYSLWHVAWGIVRLNLLF